MNENDMTLPYETINVTYKTFVSTIDDNEVPTKRLYEKDNGKRVTNSTSVEERTNSLGRTNKEGPRWNDKNDNGTSTRK